MKKFLKAVKLFGIAASASFAVLAVVYFFQTRTVAGGNEYKAVTVDYTAPEKVTSDAAEQETETAAERTTEQETVKETETQTTEPETEETQAQTTAQVTQTQTEASVVEVQTTAPATEAQTAAPVTEAQTEAPAEEVQTAAPVQTATATELTNVVYKDGNQDEYHYATLDEAKAAIKVPTLSDAEAKAAAAANKKTYASLATEVVNLINEYRAANGLAKLTVNDTLSTAAMHRAAESAYSDWNMTALENGVKRHIRPNFRKASTIAEEYGIGGNFGENFGRWQQSPAEIVAGWKASSSHNALLLSGEYTQIGIGIAQDSYGDYYWIALFN